MIYKPELAEQLPAMFSEGESVAEVIVKLGISRACFYKWVNKYPEFAEAYEEGKTVAEAWWSKLGRKGASGKADINPSVWIFNMKAKFGYRENQQLDINVKGGLGINANVSVEEELKKRGIPLPEVGTDDLPDIEDI